MSPGFLEGLNSVFSTLIRKAYGYRSRDYMIAMLCCVAGKLSMPSRPNHWKERGILFLDFFRQLIQLSLS